MVNKTILGIAALFVAGVFLSGIGVFSTVNTLQPEFDECQADEQGDITGCNPPADTNNRIEDLGYEYGKNAGFRVRLDHLAPDSRPVWADFAEQDGFDWRDVNGTYLRSLEEESSCSLTADISFDAYGKIETTEGQFTYTTEPDSSHERQADDMMSGAVTVQSESVDVRGNGDVLCRFRINDFYSSDKWNVEGSFERQTGGWPPIVTSESVTVDFERTTSDTGSGSGSVSPGVDPVEDGNSLLERIVLFLRSLGLPV